MAVYTVHVPDESKSEKKGDLAAQAEQVVFIPERFSLLAVIFALPWLLVHRLWLASAVFVVLVTALNAAGAALGLGEQTLGFFSLALSVLVGFEAHNLRRLALQRSGYKLVAVVSASNRQDAEHQFFSEWLRGRGGTPEQPRERDPATSEATAPA